MTDIVERLRSGTDEWYWEAANEIERLRDALNDERGAHQVCVEMRNDAEREMERLREEVEYWKGLVPHQIRRDFPFARRALEGKE